MLLPRAGGEEPQFIGGGWRERFLKLLTRALLAIGRQADAKRAAVAAHACADAVALPSATAMPSLAAAALALDAGPPMAAAERALAAAAALESVAAPFRHSVSQQRVFGREYVGEADQCRSQGVCGEG